MTEVPHVFNAMTLLQNSSLQFNNITEEYNNTAIHCFATVSGVTKKSPGAILLVQGIISSPPNINTSCYAFVGVLSAVSSLDIEVFGNNCTATASWMAPFTLDIPETNPDITYNVIACDPRTSDKLDERYNYNMTEISFPVICDDSTAACVFLASVSVTPVNLAGQGRSSASHQGILSESESNT